MGAAFERISPGKFAAAVDWIADELMPSIGVGGPHSNLSIEYVGGEILTTPMPELRKNVFYARERFSALFGRVRDGAQSNLIASEAKVGELDAIFNGRIGTSTDRLGTQRTVGGSAEKYRDILTRSEARLGRRRRTPPGAIFVVDKTGLPSVHYELEKAEEEGRSLVLRPVFEGGKDVEKADRADMVDELGSAFDNWAMRSTVSVEPFRQLLDSRIAVLTSGAVPGRIASCPFQRNCAEVSLNLEPNGDLYVCLDMSDSGQHKLGNALEQTFDRDLWLALRNRKTKIDPKCAVCPFLSSCQGGCMSAAIHDTGDIYGRPDLCQLWTDLFHRIDNLVAMRGAPAVAAWAATLN